MNGFAEIIKHWPNAEVFASDIGVKGVTARQWKRRGSIPPEHWKAVVAAAEKRAIEGVTLEALAEMATQQRAA